MFMRFYTYVIHLLTFILSLHSLYLLINYSLKDGGAGAMFFHQKDKLVGATEYLQQRSPFNSVC